MPSKYCREDLLRILSITAQQMKEWERTGLVVPRKEYSFADLLEVKKARDVADGIKPSTKAGPRGSADSVAFLFKTAAQYEDDPATQDKAAELYRQVLQEDPEHAASRINLGTILYNQRKLQEAGVQYRLAIAADSKYALAHFDLGNVEDELGDTAEAIRCYKRAIELGPTYSDAHYNLALAYEKTREPHKALQHWQRYIKLDPAGGPWTTHAR